MRIVTADEIFASVGVGDLLAPIANVIQEVSAGRAKLPARFAEPVSDKGRIGIMYGAIGAPAIHGAKLLSLFPGAAAHGLSSHQGIAVIFDSDTGRPLATFDADALTALRTAAATLVATRVLARPDPATFAVLGAGEQAEWHIHGVTGATFDDGLIYVTGGGTEVGGNSGSLLNQVYRPDVRCQ